MKLIATTAPVEYDYAHTVNYGYMDNTLVCGKPVRLVDVEDGFGGQVNRYASGLYLAVPFEELPRYMDRNLTLVSL